MGKHVLITGGGGFIGSHLADELLREGYDVRALDSLESQVHGSSAGRPDYLDPNVEFLAGDIRDRQRVRESLRGVDIVCHLAAVVGVGQSMYELARYTGINNMGTAILLEELIDRPVERLIVASSMSVYGEGMYAKRDGRPAEGATRSLAQLRRGDWEIRGHGGEPLDPVPTAETKQPDLSSVYALSKYDQERLCLMIGRTYDIPAVALRFFNVYGPRQALSNPYTGVLAIFASRLLNDRPPGIYEDGKQRRDFVSVYDAARACRLALENPVAEGGVFNVGSGQSHSVREIAERLSRVIGKEHIEPEITGKYRSGDIRHCFADISLARDVLGFEPRMLLDEGLAELAEWLEGQVAHDRVPEASAALASRGLTV